MRVVIDHYGRELVAENRPEGNWWVRFSEREAEARHLDYALADVLRIPRSQAVPIAMTILRQLPTDSATERPTD